MDKRTKNDIHSIFRNKKSQDVSPPIRLANPELDRVVIENLAKQLEQSDVPVVFKTGLGFQPETISTVPIRLPAVLIPTLEVIRRLSKLDVGSVSYDIYTATNYLAELYDLDLETASEAIKKRVAYIRKFIARFYPDIADKINFYDGSEEDYEETRRRINDLVQKITVEEASNPRLAGIINQLKLSARKYGCTDAEAYSYLAANFVYGGNLDSYSPFASPNEATVISTGGVSEMPFFNFNSEFARPNKHAGLIVPFGSRPTYYPCLDRSDPVSHCEFEDCFKSEFGSVTDFHIRSDLQALAKKGLTPEVLGEIY